MRFLYKLLLVAIFASSLSCQGLRVTYDYDRDAEYSNYATYNNQPDLNTGLSDLDTKRLLRATDSLLLQKGFKRSQTPDLFLEIYSNTFEDRDQSSVGLGLGGTGRTIGGGIQVGIPISGTSYNREIVFNIIDRSRDQLIFQAVSKSKYSENRTPKEREKILTKIAVKVFEGFPPQ